MDVKILTRTDFHGFQNALKLAFGAQERSLVPVQDLITHVRGNHLTLHESYIHTSCYVNAHARRDIRYILFVYAQSQPAVYYNQHTTPRKI